MYRIISGKWKGKRILAPKNFEVRPTTDFAKEAIFSVIQNQYNLTDCKVLDLFAGIGSISFEFASRNCQKIVSIETNGKHVKFINETSNQLGFEDKMMVIRNDVFTFLKRNKESFDIVFADPPFDFEEAQYTEILNAVFQKKMLNENGMLIIEHAKTTAAIETENYVESRNYGNLTFSIYR